MTALPRLLLIDDEKDNVESLTRLLRKEFQIESFLSAEAALKFLQKDSHFDVLLSDERMPGMSGSEFFEQALQINPRATRILLTGYADLDAVGQAINRGHIWNYLSKPWEPEELRLVLQQAAERSRLQQSLDESRHELQKAVRELRARDWARGRMLNTLLHEFRTAPQVLEALRELNEDASSAESRKNFITRLLTRFKGLEKEILGLLQEEESYRKIPREKFSLPQWFKELCQELRTEAQDRVVPDLALYSHPQILREDLSLVWDLLKKNTAHITPQVSLEKIGAGQLQVFLIFSLGPSPHALYPQALEGEMIEMDVAWTALFEPFVGSEDFKKHSQGLRLEVAQRTRRLAALGARIEFQVQKGSENKVEALISLPLE